MKQISHTPMYAGRLQQRFIQTHYDRHDALELQLEARKYDDACLILSDIHDSAPSDGMSVLGDAAGICGDFIASELRSDDPDPMAMHAALNAFLDVSMEFCNPTERFLATG